MIAHRAREIASEAEEKGEQLEKKPVSYAIDEIAEGRLNIKTKDN